MEKKKEGEGTERKEHQRWARPTKTRGIGANDDGSGGERSSATRIQETGDAVGRQPLQLTGRGSRSQIPSFFSTSLFMLLDPPTRSIDAPSAS